MPKDDAKVVSDEQLSRLAEAFLSLTDKEECKAFFYDLFTVKEMAEISSRLEVARLLKCGMNYIDIAAKTGASTATISRVSKCLAGPVGGYRMVLKRAESDMTVDDGVIRVDVLSEAEADAVRAIVACLKDKNGK